MCTSLKVIAPGRSIAALAVSLLAACSASGVSPGPTTLQCPRDVPRDAPAPETPDRCAVRAALNEVAPVVRACGDGGSVRTVQVVMLFASSGHTTRVTVPAELDGTDAGRCIVRAAGAAHLPPFHRESFSVSYPFVLR